MPKNMANIGGSRPRGGKYCVAGGTNNVSCTNGQYTKGVSIHNFPNANKEPERHGAWVKFVRKHRPGWNPSSTSIYVRQPLRRFVFRTESCYFGFAWHEYRVKA